MSTAAPDHVTWSVHAFDALTAAELHDALHLRARVFVVEQTCAYCDPDEYDRSAAHLFGRVETGALAAYLRMLPPGTRFEEPSIGRVVVAPEQRGLGLGRALMLEGMRETSGLWPGRAVRISAQRYLERFYASLGFVSEGLPFEEDGIPHVEMVLPVGQ